MRAGVWAAAGVVVGVSLTVAPTAWAYLASVRHRAHPGRAGADPVAIVLGALVGPYGRPCTLLARRLDIAARLFRSGVVTRILVSGDNRPWSNFETDTMTAYLVDAGVPTRAIDVDPHGYRTWDTCVRARDIFGVRRAIVVTQSFHLPRAVMLCRAAGVDATGVGDPSLPAAPRPTVRGYLRELGANHRALVDAAVRTPPARLDP